MAGIRNPVPRDLVPGFAALVTAARKARGWSQRELARQADVSAMCVCEVEGERRSPSLRTAVAIAKALEIDVALKDPAPGAKAKQNK